MFFDDRLNTVLDGPVPDGWAARVQYTQLVDLLAQKTNQMAPEQLAAGLARIHKLRAKVDDADRLNAVKSVSGRLKNAPLIQYLAADNPDIVRAVISSAKMDDESWADIVPQLSDEARSNLRDRWDIGPKTQHALDSGRVQPHMPREKRFQSAHQSDRSATENAHENSLIEGDIAKTATLREGGEREIGKIVERIEKLRQSRISEGPQLPLGDEFESKKPEFQGRFNFETDDSGAIIWTDGEPAGAICGVNISRPALDGASGPDAYASSAFRQRVPMDGARLILRGAAELHGSWRIIARPFFDRMTGRFKGFRGEIRRPLLGEQAENSASTVQSDAIRQLIHELRTPLNAIQGFAEIIEQQLFGPVAYDYRSLSSDIMKDAKFMLSGFDDLDVALRIDSNALNIEEGMTTKEILHARITERLSSNLNEDSAKIKITFSDDFNGFALAQSSTERMVMRLLSTLVTSGGSDEELQVRFDQSSDNKNGQMTIDLPSHMRTMDREKIFNPDNGDEGEVHKTPLLGVGFSLRLVRNLAQQAGGDLISKNGVIRLTIPANLNSETKEQGAIAE